jgi:hypothetical protein
VRLYSTIKYLNEILKIVKQMVEARAYRFERIYLDTTWGLPA